jgi:hypothetical protein
VPPASRNGIGEQCHHRRRFPLQRANEDAGHALMAYKRPALSLVHRRLTDFPPKPASDRWVIVSWIGICIAMSAILIGLAQLFFYLDRIAE